MNREWFFKNGARLYIGSLLLLAVIFFSVFIGDQWSLLPLMLFMFFLAGNIKITHGIMFNEGKLKLWNQFCSVMFNGLTIGWCIYYLYLYTLNA